MTLHANAHGVVPNATDHDEVEFYTEPHQHETDGIQSTEATNVYQQETECNVMNRHSLYIASSYSSFSDAYPGSADHQMDYAHSVGGVTYSPSVYGETLPPVLAHGTSSLNSVTQAGEAFASYST